MDAGHRVVSRDGGSPGIVQSLCAPGPPQSRGRRWPDVRRRLHAPRPSSSRDWAACGSTLSTIASHALPSVAPPENQSSTRVGVNSFNVSHRVALARSEHGRQRGHRSGPPVGREDPRQLATCGRAAVRAPDRLSRHAPVQDDPPDCASTLLVRRAITGSTGVVPRVSCGPVSCCPGGPRDAMGAGAR